MARNEVSPLRIPASEGVSVEDLLLKLELKEQNEEVLIDRLKQKDRIISE